MEDGSTSFYLAPACWNYKNGDKIFGAMFMKKVKNESDLKSNKKKSTIYFNATHSRQNQLNGVYIIRRNNDVVYNMRLLEHQYSGIYKHKSHRILLTNEHKSDKSQNNLLNKGRLKSVPSFNISNYENKLTSYFGSKSCHQITINPAIKSNYVVNTVSDCPDWKCFHTNAYSKLRYKVYRCQFNTKEESCCCSCNSDAMFEVMKSLYDCYKKKNCDNCNCILCGHLPREERRLGELRKSEAKLSKKLRSKSKATLAMDYEAKSPAEKENILREMAMAGVPMPEGKTKSEKDLIKKIRTEVGLPQEPITSADKKKMSEAYKTGLIKPLEGKTTAEKERILTKQAELGIPLPEGRTPSEKALIEKAKASVLHKSQVPSEKIRKAKAAGLLTPLEGKPKEQKEEILKGLAMQGIPLPEAKTASEKKLMDRIRAEVGLPPEPKLPSDREKYDRAMAAGLITPLEGKSIGKKEKILRDQARIGLPLPEGRTPSEKALIAKIKEKTQPEKILPVPSEKLRKAKAAGLLTPLEGKPKEQKEKILKGLAMQGIPLPEAKTASEKKLMDKIRAEVGLPPEPKLPSDREKYDRAMAAGLITPLEGKSIGKKEKILRDQAMMGLPLPEGRTPSEKALIAKVKEKIQPEKIVRVPSEKLRKAKAAGLLSPLQGKSKEQKEKILKGLAMQGIPLPEAKTASEKKLMDKIRAEIGLPPEPKLPSDREKYDRAMAAGLITPLEGKSIGKKEKILRDQAMMGLPLPEGRTPSEKALIAKVKEKIQPEKIIRVPSEKLRKAKAAGLLTPLEGKPKEQKEKILKGLAMQGIPLPEAKTASEKKLMDKIRAEVGLPPEPKLSSDREKYDRAMAAGLITPLEGKSIGKKEKILRDQARMGLPLPEGRTPSEKALIAKIKATSKPLGEIPLGRPALPAEKLKKLDIKTAKVMKEKKGPSDECICDLLTPESKRERIGIKGVKPDKVSSEKIRKAKAAGLLTPLEGKPKEQKEKILKELAMQGIPLPEAKTASEKKLMDKIRAEVGLPPEPKLPSDKEKYDRAMAAGLITPLEGKSIGKKEKILRDQARMGLPLPEGRTPSEKALIAKVKEKTQPEKILRVPSEKLRKAKAAGLLTPLEGKPKEQKEKILKGLAMQGIPLPEAKTASEKKLIDRIRAEVGLPPEPKLPSDREKYDRAMAAGLITPLEGKSMGKKEKILRDQARMGLPLPEGRTPSEKALIAKVKEKTQPEKILRVPSEKLRKAKAAGLLTPLEGKPKEQKEKILKGLAMQGIPLPEAITASEKKLMDKIRAEVGLPPEPKLPSDREKYDRAMAAGLITPLEGKSIGKKEKILRDQARMGLPLPEGRTPSEKALIAKVKEKTHPEKILPVPSEKLRKAKAAGLLSPLQGKSKEQKENILKGLAMQGIPLPEAQSVSEQKLMDRIRAEVGLPPQPKTTSAKEKYDRAMAAGLITPLEGKSIGKKEKILRDQAMMGLPLPEGRTPSEKALIAKVKEKIQPEKIIRVPSEKLRKAKAAGLLTPLEGKPKEQKEKILKGLAMQGIPLPEAKTASEKQLMDKIRAEVGLPPEPKLPSDREKYDRAMAAGLITPLEGKPIGKKEKILRDQARMGLPLPEGRTPSEKALIAKIKASSKPLGEIPLGRPALPPEKLKKLDIKTAKVMKEKKGPSDECICDLLTPESKRERIGIKGVKPDKVLSEKIRKAKAAGLLTPLEGKPKEQKEKILKGLAMQGIPLPEAKTASEKKLMDRIRAEVGLPPEPKLPSDKEKYDRAMAAGLITPLEGKSIGKKEKILRDQARMGLPLPEGRTLSEKALIAKVKEKTQPEKILRVPSEKLRKAKAAGLLTPLEGKPKEQKEKILKGLAMQGIPLPEAKTASEKKLMDKIRAEVGLSPEPKLPSDREKYDRAMAAGLITPLEGKSIGKKDKILRDQARMGLPLPEGRTPSEKALIAKVKEKTQPEKILRVPSEKLRKAKAAGLLSPLQGKSKEQKENILKGLAMQGIPLPEAQSVSEQKLMDRIRAEVGLPPQPKTTSAKEKYDRAMAAGLITPLEGKSIGKKEKILQDQAKMGLPLPEGRTPSEKALIAKVKEKIQPEKIIRVPSEKLRKAKAAGLLTPLESKPKEQKEKILKGLAMQGIPLPAAKTASEKKLIDKIRAEVGLPPEPKLPSDREKYDRAMAAGLITPLEGKSIGKKEKILRDQAMMGLPLPEGRTPSEKALIAKVKEKIQPEKIVRAPSEKLRKAKAAGLLTPLEGKSKEQKEKILKGLAMQGIPLPEAKTASEKKLMDKIRAEVGLPPEPKLPSDREKYDRAMAAGLITPLEGKSIGKKEKILRDQARMGLPLPEGRTPSEKALIAKIKATSKPLGEIPLGRPALPAEKLKKLDIKTAKVMKEKKGPSDECICDLLTPESKRERIGIKGVKPDKVSSEKIRKAKAAGLLTPLEGKPKEQKEKILKGLAMQGIPLPEAKTASEKKLMDKIRAEVGLPPEPKLPSDREKYDRAMAAGLITPLEGKSIGKKEKILRDQARMGLALPEGRTPSEKALIARIKETTKKEASLAPSKVSISSEKLRQAKAAGLLTPLQGKSPEKKEKILSDLAKAGLPLPKGKTPSEKSLIRKVQKRYGISEKAEGLLTPLKGKSLAQKEKILKGLAEAGVPLPEGTTPSEKELVRKVRTMAGLPPEPTISEKRRKIKKTSKKIGVGAVSRSAKRVGVLKSKGGVIEEFEDITKTTTCDRGCGCDKKKIRFKHSYVKIRVTSPDISSFCPCPEECIPGVKGGIFTDNEGIKVTIGRVTGVPSFPSRELKKNKSTMRGSDACPDLIGFKPSINDTNEEFDECLSENILNRNTLSKQSKNSKFALNDPSPITDAYPNFISDLHKDKTVIFIKSFNNCHENPHFLENEIKEKFYGNETSTSSSLESFYLLETNSSTSLRVESDAYSIIPFSITEPSSCSDYCLQRDYLNLEYDKIYCTNENYCGNSFYRSGSTLGITNVASSTTYWSSKLLPNDSEKLFNHEIVLFKVMESKSYSQLKTLPNQKHQESLINYIGLNNNSEILDTVSRVFSISLFDASSSVIIIMPTSSEEYDANYNDSLDKIESTIFVQISANCSNWNRAKGLKLNNKGKYLKDVSLKETDNNDGRVFNNILLQNKKHDIPCRISQKADKTQRIFSNDTTEDRPCCCTISEGSRLRSCSYVTKKRFENIVPELVMPKMLKEDKAQADTSCSACTPPKWDESVNLKKIKEKSCCSCSYGYDGNPYKDLYMKKGKKPTKKNKNIICECPEEPQLEFQFDTEDWIDEAQIRKMKSDLTQTVSGFKVNMAPKTREPELSFEEILKFYAEAYEQKYKRAEYEHIKAQTKNNASVDCRCPPVEEIVEQPAEKVELPAVSDKPLQGIKFHIGGQGSGSKGLNGILCFQLLQEAKFDYTEYF